MIFQRFDISHQSDVVPAPLASFPVGGRGPIHYSSNPLKKILAVAAFTTFILMVGSVSAANHYIRAGATGLGLGTDWINAYTAIPATLIRGDTYYDRFQGDSDAQLHI